MKNIVTLCDHKECPLHNSCACFLEYFDKRKNDHWALMPYNIHHNGKCSWYAPSSEWVLARGHFYYLKKINNV